MPIVGHADDLRWSIELNRADHFLLTTVHGLANPRSWLACFKALAVAATACRCPQLLIDHRDSPLNLSILDAYDLPQHIAKQHPPADMTAALVFDRQTDPNKFLDDRFFNSALPVKVFYNVFHAITWLQFTRPSDHQFLPSNTLSPQAPVTPSRTCAPSSLISSGKSALNAVTSGPSNSPTTPKLEIRGSPFTHYGSSGRHCLLPDRGNAL